MDAELDFFTYKQTQNQDQINTDFKMQNLQKSSENNCQLTNTIFLPQLRILVIHPSGNINTNPNLHDMLKFLSVHGFIIDYLCFDNSSYFYQEPTFSNLTFFKIDTKMIKDNAFGSLKLLLKNNYALIMGTHEGIGAASVLAKKLNIPYILLSYELFFADECGVERKEKEIKACEEISLAICQDPVRSFLLARENQIPFNKIINIPVSGIYEGPYEKSNFLREKFSIDKNKKIALLAGTISDRTMFKEIIKQVPRWPDNWVLVLHSFVGVTKSYSAFLSRIKRKIYLSDIPFNTITTLDKLYCSSDLSLCLTSPIYGSEYAQKNVVFMGLSSGKISTSFKYGVPVILNNIGQMSDYVREYGLGVVIDTPSDINSSLLDKYDYSQLSKNCTIFFKNKLDFNIYSDTLLRIIDDIIKKRPIRGEDVADINKINSFIYPISLVNQIIDNYNRANQMYSNKIHIFDYDITYPLDSMRKQWLLAKQILKKRIFYSGLRPEENILKIVNSL